MKVRIIANKPISENCTSIEPFIGKELDTYIDESGKLIAKHEDCDFILFDGEYEVINE